MPAIRRLICGLIVVNSLVACGQPHGVRVLALNLLGHQTHVCLGVPLVFVGINLLAIVGFTYGAHILLQALI